MLHRPSHFWEVKWGQMACQNSEYFPDLDEDSIGVNWSCCFFWSVCCGLQMTAHESFFDTFVYIVLVRKTFLKMLAWYGTQITPVCAAPSSVACRRNGIDQDFPHRITLRASTKACSRVSEKLHCKRKHDAAIWCAVLQVQLQFTDHWRLLQKWSFGIAGTLWTENVVN